MGRPKNSKNSQYWDSLPFCMRHSRLVLSDHVQNSELLY
eukprot:COSAG02_NODE_23_length_52893_cov_58.101868_32_plen_39_part_00